MAANAIETAGRIPQRSDEIMVMVVSGNHMRKAMKFEKADAITVDDPNQFVKE